MLFYGATEDFIKNEKYYDKDLEKYEVILFVSMSILTFGFYPLFKSINYFSEQKKIGVFRKLEHGNIVIRDTNKAEKRLRTELAVRQPDGFKFFKNLRIPKVMEVLNMLISGAMGSGKTVILAPITLEFYEKKYPSIILDNKGDFCQLLAGKEAVTVMSPFDARSPVWDVASDVENELEAIEFVSQLIPIHGGSNDFFPLAARDLVLGAIKFLQATKPNSWNMQEVLETISRDDFLSVLKKYHLGALETLKDCFEKDGKIVVGETSTNIFQNVRASLKNFEILSKAWPQSVGGFSIKKWVRGQRDNSLFIIVPFKQIYPEMSGFFNGIILDSFIKEAINLPDSRERRMGLFLDELGAIPRINSLANGMKLLRSKGICVFVGIQEVGVIRKKYEQDGGTEVLLNGFSTKLVGRSETPEYAEYFIRLFGKNRYEKTTRNRSLDSKGKSSTNTSTEEVVEDAISSGELLSIPPASLKGGAIFFMKTSDIPVIFKLKFPVIPLERPYPDSIEADWIKKDHSPISEKANLAIESLKEALVKENLQEELSQSNEQNIKTEEENTDFQVDSIIERKGASSEEKIEEKAKNEHVSEDVDLSELAF